jgi:hypothetical protein
MLGKKWCSYSLEEFSIFKIFELLVENSILAPYCSLNSETISTLKFFALYFQLH